MEANKSFYEIVWKRTRQNKRTNETDEVEVVRGAKETYVGVGEHPTQGGRVGAETGTGEREVDGFGVDVGGDTGEITGGGGEGEKGVDVVVGTGGGGEGKEKISTITESPFVLAPPPKKIWFLVDVEASA
jgi:hypothetical protein